MVRAIWCGCILLALGVAALLVLAPARAQNLDEGKSGARLFTDTCVTCHHSAKGLTKGRFRVTLYLFLQQHYASNSGAAWELASYLESVDETPRSRPRPAAAKRPPHGTGLAGGSLRPPASIPQR
jgi:mono/diheme cytochrome c family protein